MTTLLLHGALGSHHQLEPLIPLLGEEVHTFSFEGHGGRWADQPYSSQLFVDNVLAYLDENSLDQVCIFGYSMGGYVALQLALQHPNRIAQIVTLGTKFHWTPEAAAREVKMLNPEKVEEKVPAFAQRLHQLHQPLDWKAVMHQTANMMLRMGNGERLEEADFQQIQCPVTIGWGTKDQMVSQQESEQVAGWLPNGQFHSLEDVPHPIDLIDQGTIVSYIQSQLT